MLTPTVVFLLTSYVGPVASPDVYLGAHTAAREERRIERDDAEYITPESRRMRNRYNRQPVTPEAERAEEGRMVVPREFR